MGAGVAQVIVGVVGGGGPTEPIPVPFNVMLCVADDALSELSVRVSVSLRVPVVVGKKSMLRLQLAFAASEKLDVQSGGVPLPVARVKSAGRVRPGATAVSAALPKFSTVTVCGLSLLVEPTFVEAKLNDGGAPAKSSFSTRVLLTSDI